MHIGTERFWRLKDRRTTRLRWKLAELKNRARQSFENGTWTTQQLHLLIGLRKNRRKRKKGALLDMRELSSEQNMSSERRVLGKSRQVEAVEPFRERKVLAYKGLESLPTN